MKDQEKNKQKAKQVNKINLDYDYLMISHRQHRILIECPIIENGVKKCQYIINLPLTPSMMGKIDSIIERCLTLKINESKQQYIQDTFDAFLAAKVKNRIQSKSSTDRSKNNSEGRLVV